MNFHPSEIDEVATQSGNEDGADELQDVPSPSPTPSLTSASSVADPRTPSPFPSSSSGGTPKKRKQFDEIDNVMPPVEWTRTKTLHLIELLKEHPSIWNIKSKKYNKNIRNASLETIRADVSRFNNCTLRNADINKKVHTLKTQFHREMSAIKASQKSEAITGDVYIPKLWCFDNLRVLPDGEPSTSTSNLDGEATTAQVAEIDSEQETDAVIESPHQNETPQSASQSPRSSVEKPVDQIKEASHFMKSLTEHVTTRNEYHVFGENIAHKLRDCGRSKREILIAQHKINEIIFNLEMGNIGEDATQFPQHSSHIGRSYSRVPMPTSQDIPQYFTAPSGAATPSCSPSLSAWKERGQTSLEQITSTGERVPDKRGRGVPTTKLHTRSSTSSNDVCNLMIREEDIEIKEEAIPTFSDENDMETLSEPQKDPLDIEGTSKEAPMSFISEVESVGTENADEFHFFGMNVASQLRALPLRDALQAQLEIQTILTQKRSSVLT